jgi:NADPH:quinone reductase-like Zn-dependent oxidoreductase
VKAYVQRGHGGHEVCSFEDLALPVPGPGEVLLKVEAAGLNRLDLLQRQAPLVRGFALPHVAGMDVVGTVVAHGRGVVGTTVEVASRVLVDPVTTCRNCEMCLSDREPYCASLQTIGSTRQGGFAEYVAVPADRCWPVPAHLSTIEAAAMPVAYLTAWQALVAVGKVQPGEVVVVNAANAGVSMAAIQLAKRAGATVLGTVRGPDRMSQIAALGCDHVIDSTDPATIAEAVRALTGGSGADLIIDHVGPAQFAASVEALGVEGRLVFCGTTTGVRVELALTDVYWWGRQLLGSGGYRPRDVGLMLAAVNDAKLVPVVDEAAPFTELPRLLDRLERGSVIGKLVVTMS